MPKRVGFLYERMKDTDFVRRCIVKAAKGKRRRRGVRQVLEDVEGYTARMVEIVRNHDFTPRQPTHRTIYDPNCEKWREISSIPFFPDAIMHQITVTAMQDVLMRGMSPWSCASVPGRGGARVRKRIMQVLQKDPKGTKYAMEADIKHYYPSIPLEGLLDALERKIKDKTFLLLVMVEVTCYPGGLGGAMEKGLTARDLARGKVGIEIGFYLDQWLANFYLERADHLMERDPGVKYEVRHMDNFTLFGPNKRKLHRAREALERHFEADLGVKMKGNWQVYRTGFTGAAEKRHRLLPPRQRSLRRPRRVAAVGYRFDHEHVTLRGRNFLRLTRQSRKIQKKQATGRNISFHQAAGFLSRAGQLRHCDSYKIQEKYIQPVDIRQLKTIVRNRSNEWR